MPMIYEAVPMVYDAMPMVYDAMPMQVPNLCHPQVKTGDIRCHLVPIRCQ